MALQPIIAYRLESKTLTNYLKVPDELKVKLEWVYGLRTLDCKRPMQYLVGRMQAQSTGQVDKYEKMSKLVNEELIYFVANIVILLNANICKQRFYVQH
jgi:WD40 repeat protein